MLPGSQPGHHHIAFVALVDHLQERFEIAVYALQIEVFSVIGVITHHGKFDDGGRQIGIGHLDLNIEQPFFGHHQAIVLSVILVVHGIAPFGEDAGLVAAIGRKVRIFRPFGARDLER